MYAAGMRFYIQWQLLNQFLVSDIKLFISALSGLARYPSV